MKKIYLVCYYDYDEHDVIAAFFDRDAALEYQHSLGRAQYGSYDLEEYDVLDS